MLSVWCRNVIKNTNLNNGVNEVAARLVAASPPGVCHGPILYISNTYSFYLQVKRAYRDNQLNDTNYKV